MNRQFVRARRPFAWLLAVAVSCVAQPAVTAIESNADSSLSAQTVRAPGAKAQAPPATKAAASKIAESLARAPLSFEANVGQAGERIKFISRGDGHTLLLASTEATFAFRKMRGSDLGLMNDVKNGSMRETVTSQSQVCNTSVSALRMRLVGASPSAEAKGLDVLSAKSNYFIGNDTNRWRAGVFNYARVKVESVYSGIDVVYYGNQRELEYDFNVAPGADYKAIRLAFDGAKNISITQSGDLVIETAAGEVHQSKPVVYQEVEGKKRIIEGVYAIRGKLEVGFEVADYDKSKPLVIDPVLVYSTSIGGSYNDNSKAIAIDAAGAAYIAGTTTSLDLPTLNAFQSSLVIGGDIGIGIPSDVFIAKLNPSGTAFVYVTYLGGGSEDAANAIAVDAEGNAYVTGYSGSIDFPTTPDAFRTKAINGGSAFVTKLNRAGNALVYSTYLGGAATSSFGTGTNVGFGIAVDKEGSAYVTGRTFSPSFPLKRAAQSQFNNGAQIGPGCIVAIGPPGISPLIDAFVTKLDPSGSALVYSTYLGGSGQEEGRGIALDSEGNAYITGTTCSRDLPATRGGPRGRGDIFLSKLNASGREFLYSTYYGGSGYETSAGVAIDSAGFFALTGTTDSTDLLPTPGPLQAALVGSAAYVTDDAGNNWTAGSGLPNTPVSVLAVDPLNPSTIYAGFGECSKAAAGVFKSVDGAKTWRAVGPATAVFLTIAGDPKNPSVIYAGGSGLFKSTDAGNTWNRVSIGFTGGFVDAVVLDPVNTSTVYLKTNGYTCGDVVERPVFLKSTDAGATWNPFHITSSSFAFVSALAIDPKNPSTLYATSGNLYKSTDGGSTWNIPYQGVRDLTLLAIDPTNTATLYFRNSIGSLFKSADAGVTFSNLGLNNQYIEGLVVDPVNPSTLYAGLGDQVGGGGGVFKSTDGGASWAITDLSGVPVSALTIDPVNSSRVYAGTYDDLDALIARGPAETGSISYLSYLGGRGRDIATGVAVDGAGSAYLTGQTLSERFPTKDALQPTKTNGPFATAAFVTKIIKQFVILPGESAATRLNPSSDAIEYSTYLGGDEPSAGKGIAVDPAGRIYVTGDTGGFRTVPSLNSVEAGRGGIDAFIVKFAMPPRITAISISGKLLFIIGEGFDRNAVVLVNNVEQKAQNDEMRPTTLLIVKKAAKNIAPGQRVTIQVRNADGMLSNEFVFTRSSQ